jgi:hypothetical protein
MTPDAFAAALMAYCMATSASVTSWGRTRSHNVAVGSTTPDSAHLIWTGADVVYDYPAEPAGSVRESLAHRLGLMLIHEGDHDHVQPAR